MTKVIVLCKVRAVTVIESKDGIDVRPQAGSVVDIQRNRLAGEQCECEEVHIILATVPRSDDAVDRYPRQRRITDVRARLDAELRAQDHVGECQRVVVFALVDHRRS